jgi:hypothetical protein
MEEEVVMAEAEAEVGREEDVPTRRERQRPEEMRQTEK